MRFLRTNTAIRLTVGPFLDKTDGITPEVAITVTSCKLTLMVDDANVPTLILDAAPTASGGANDMVHVTGDDSGFYDLELAAANLNYLGRAILSINDVAVHCPVFHEFMILPAVVYDAMVLGTDKLQVHADEITAGLITATAIAADAITAAKLHADVTTELQSGLATSAALSAVASDTAEIGPAGSGLTSINLPNQTMDIVGNITGNLSGSVGSVTGLTAATVHSDLDDIQSRLPAALSGGNMKVDVLAISGDLTAADNLEAAADGSGFNLGAGLVVAASVTGAVGGNLAGDVLGNVGGGVTGSVGSVAGSIGSLAAQAKVDVKGQADQALVDVGVTGTVTGRIDAAISTRSTVTTAQVNAEVVDALTIDIMADSVATDGTRPTIGQALYMIAQFLMERSVSGTTVTVKKVDGSTSLMTFTLNDGTTPTSITRG